MKSLIGVLLTVLLAACVTPAKVQINSSYDIAEARRLMEPGPNSITGNAFLRQAGGGVVTCAGRPVFLFPSVAYNRERLASVMDGEGRTYRRASSMPARVEYSNDAPQFRVLTHETVCDSQGRFTFERIADGEFFVLTEVTWMNAGFREGGLLLQRVTVSGGQVRSLVMSGN